MPGLPAPASLLRPAVLWPLLVMLCAAAYLLGLGGPYAPTNGDEMVYIHIARMTAESGHWLPLQSELADTRNTKPPLLIWQAMVAGGWGQHWSLLALRLPSVLYTFATTGLLAFFAWRISGRQRTAWLAAAIYLLCFSTFRYGRAYLTSAPETFWLALPMWWALWLQLQQRRPNWMAFGLMGVAMGLGAAYKSFALVAPAAAALWCALLPGSRTWAKPFQTKALGPWRELLRCTAGVALSAAIGLAIFALWFALDPDPAAVWQEFVVAENAGKMSTPQGYWYAALFGTYPMWTQLLAYPINAGLLLFVGLGWMAFLLRRAVVRATYAALSPAHGVLLAWLLVWLIVFTIPSQRSERYLIPAMPAFAIVLALIWDRMSRWGFVATLLLLAPALVMIGRIAWVIGGMDVGSPDGLAFTLLVVACGLAAIGLGLGHAAWTRNATLVAVLAVYGGFTLMTQPLSSPQAGYAPEVRAALQGKRLAVPNGFTGQYERYHFALPGARITPFDAEGRNTGAYYPDMPRAQRLDRLLHEFDAVAWLQDSPQELQASCLPQCRLLGQRWHVKTRHRSGEITLSNLWYPQEWLFRREWLLANP